MIVNPAYIYFTKKTPLPDFNLWGNGVVNVPYTVSDTNWIPSGNVFYIYGGGYVEFTVNAKGYSKIKIEMSAASTYGGNIHLVFYDSTGSLISDVSQKLTNSRKSYTIDIPNAARISGAKIRFNNAEPNIRKSLYMATLQE